MATRKSKPVKSVTEPTDVKPIGYRTRYAPKLIRTSLVTMYQPAVPLRCVFICANPTTGDIKHMEDHVLGVQAVVLDEYLGQETPISLRTDENHPTPVTYTAADILKAGYQPERDLISQNGKVQHSPVIWDFEACAPVVLDEIGATRERPNYARVIGPANAGADWWQTEINKAEREIYARMQNRRRAA